MPGCCPCMGSGRCIRWVRVKAGRRCTDCGLSKCDPTRCQSMTEPCRRVSNASSKGNQSSIMSIHNDFFHNRSNDTSPSVDTNSTNCRTDMEIRDTETQDKTESVSFSNHFTWGESDSECFIPAVSSAYKEIVHWRQSIFMIPSGPSGKEFLQHLWRDPLCSQLLYRRWWPCQPCCCRSPTTALKQRTTFIAWNDAMRYGRQKESKLVQEGRVIQQHLPVPAASK